MKKRCEASIIICTYNRSSLLSDAILSVQNQNFPSDRYEIIIVDNHSTDDTSNVVDAMSATSPVTIRYVFEPRQGLSYARNTGVRSASSDIVAFTDDDACADRGWLPALLDALDDRNHACVGGPVRPLWPDHQPQPIWLRKEWEWCLSISEFEKANIDGFFLTDGYHPYGVNIAFRKDVLESIGLFPIHLGRLGSSLLGGEEVDVCNKINRAGFRIAFASDAVIYHKIGQERIKKSWFFKRLYWQGRSESILVGDKHLSGSLQTDLARFCSTVFTNEQDVFSKKCMQMRAIGHLDQSVRNKFRAIGKKKKNICITRSGHLGDVIMTEPIARYFKTRFYDVYLATDYPQSVLLLNGTYADVIPCEKIADYDIAFSDTLNLSYEQSLNNVSYIEGYAQSAGIELADKIPVINSTWQRIIEDDYILLAPNTSNFIKLKRNWSADNFQKLKTMIEDTYKIKAITLDDGSFVDMISLIRHCSMIIGCDSAPGIIAQCFGKRSFILFGATDPKYVVFDKNTTAIYNEHAHDGCGHMTRWEEIFCRSRHCMSEFTVEYVFEKISVDLDRMAEKN